MSSYLDGVLLGLPLIFLVGPVLITLLQAALQQGFRMGLAVAIGISSGDVLYLFVCFFGLLNLVHGSLSEKAMGWTGGLILIAFGLGSLLKAPQWKMEDLDGPNQNWFTWFIKGFLVNFVNPFVFSFWLGAMALANARFKGSGINIFYYFAGTMTVVFLSDSLKALIADKLQPLINEKKMSHIHRIAGAGLCFYGIFLIWKVLY